MPESTGRQKHSRKRSCCPTKGSSVTLAHTPIARTQAPPRTPRCSSETRHTHPQLCRAVGFLRFPSAVPVQSLELCRADVPRQTADTEALPVPHRQHAGDLPDGSRLIPFVEPVLRWDYVHAPEAPVVAVGCVGVLLHFKGVVLDVVNRW